MKYQFADCLIDLATQELHRNGEAVSVEPQVFELLVFLVENREKLVSYDELITSVWRGRVVSDSAIAARISAARKAMGDNGKKQSVIKTVSRKGFKFLPPVRIIPDPVLLLSGNRMAMEERHLAPGFQQVRFCQSTDGTNIAFALTGSGIPLLRTGHWLTHLEHDWQSPIWRPLLDELGQRFEVVRYDQRGNGLSDWDVQDFSFERFGEDLEAVVEAAGLDRFVLYATSQGVPVAVKYATQNPQRVSHLVLHGGYVTGRLARQDKAEIEQGQAILTLIKHGWGLAGSPFLKSFSAMYIPDSTGEQMDSLAELQKLTTNADNALALRKAVDNFDVSELLARVNVKTLVMHARNDGVHPLEQGRLLASGISGSEFVMLESANHALLPQERAWPRFFLELDRFVNT